MKAKDIVVGGRYVAKVSGKLTTVRVDEIRDDASMPWRRNGVKPQIAYDVTNLTTGRKTTFRSAAKFRYEAGKETFEHHPQGLFGKR